MTELEEQFKKDNGIEQQVKLLTQHIKQLRKENKELHEKIDTIHEAVEDGAVTQEERNELRVKAMNGGAADADIAKVMKKAKTGNGVPVGQVESILGSSRKHALEVMRKIRDEFEGYNFTRGKGNKPSKLNNTKPAKDSDFID